MPKTYLQHADELLLQALSIPGLSGEEGAIMAFLVDQLRQAGATDEVLGFDQAHRKIPHGGQIGNLVLKLPGTRPGPRRLLMAHVDTVPICRGARPVKKGKYIVPADKHTALGADDRTGTSAILAAALYVLTEKPAHGPLTFLWTVQEEVGLYGARYATIGMLGRPKLAFNFDGGPTDKVTIGATGGYRMAIRISGTASHAGAAPNGASAPSPSPRWPSPTCTARAGWARSKSRRAAARRTSASSRAARPRMSSLRKFTSAPKPAATTRLSAERSSRRSKGPSRRPRGASRTSMANAARVEIDGRLDYESFRLPDDNPSVLAAEEAIRSLGGNPLRAISNGGLDANWLSARGIPTVSLGCGQENPHTPAERLDCGEFHRACEIARKLAMG